MNFKNFKQEQDTANVCCFKELTLMLEPPQIFGNL